MSQEKHITRITAGRAKQEEPTEMADVDATELRWNGESAEQSDTSEKPEHEQVAERADTTKKSEDTDVAEHANTINKSTNTDAAENADVEGKKKKNKEAKKDKKGKKDRKKEKKEKKIKKLDEEERPLSTYFVLVRPFVGLGRYLRDSWRELRQVRWPNRKATWKMTLAVLVYCAIMMVFILLLDTLFTFLFELFLKK